MTRILVPLTLCCLALAGCELGGNSPVQTFKVTGAPISGKLLSGTVPLAGAHVYLMAVAETGYGKASISLLDSGSTGSQDLMANKLRFGVRMLALGQARKVLIAN